MITGVYYLLSIIKIYLKYTLKKTETNHKARSSSCTLIDPLCGFDKVLKKTLALCLIFDLTFCLSSILFWPFFHIKRAKKGQKASAFNLNIKNTYLI